MPIYQTGHWHPPRRCQACRAPAKIVAEVARGPALMYRIPVTLSAVVYHETDTGWFVAFNPETGTTTQGRTIEEALANLKEATELYLEEFPRPRADHPFLTTFEAHPAHA